jgi:hypothetical protein
MAVTDEFRQAVEDKKIIRVRIMLKDSMLVDPTMLQFDEMLSFALPLLDNLYDEHDDEILEYDKTKWNENYLNKEMVTIVNNFSKDRIELLRNIVKYLYKVRAELIKNNRQQSTSSSFSRKQIGMGVTVAGTAVTIVGLCTAEGLIVAGGVVIAAAGVAMIVTDKG